MIDTSKWTLETMWNLVLDTQSLGIKYHHEMTQIFSLIDMKGYVEWQKERMLDEGNTSLATEIKFIKKFKKIYVPNYSQDTLLKNSFLSNNTYSSDNKRSIIDEIFTAWINWENHVCELYMACINWCILNQSSDFIFFTKLLKEVQKEKEKIEYHYSKLQDSKYNINNILEWQEYIYNKYKQNKED